MPHLLRKIRGVSLPPASVLLTLTVTVAASSFLYYYIHANTSHSVLESARQKGIKKRKLLNRPEEKYASLKVNRTFVNPFEEWTEIPFYKTVLFWLGRWKGNGIPTCEEELEKALPVLKPDLNRIKASTEGVTFTWFGQSTCLMTIAGLTILSDPVFSKCSINDHFGPKRLRPIPCQLEDFIDIVDVVIVSHDHFDHLDEAAVKKLGNTVVWYIPLGLKNWFLKRGISNVIELDWWQEINHFNRPDITFACVPAMHWSGSRTPFEKNNSLWCSYVIKSKNDNIFFCGDTGYSPELFKAIGSRYSPFTLAAIPIGSFMPTQLMQHLHMGPEDAIKAHIDLGCPKMSVGIHWGTFMMSDEHFLAPRQILDTIWQNYHASIIKAARERKESLDGASLSSTNATIEPHKDTVSNSDTFEASTTDTKFITTAFGQTIVLE